MVRAKRVLNMSRIRFLILLFLDCKQVLIKLLRITLQMKITPAMQCSKKLKRLRMLIRELIEPEVPIPFLLPPHNKISKLIKVEMKKTKCNSKN